MQVLGVIAYYAFNIYQLGLVVYVICSWIDHPTAGAIRSHLVRWYEPALMTIRRALPMVRIGDSAVDLSPIVLFIAISLVRSLVLPLLLPPF